MSTKVQIDHRIVGIVAHVFPVVEKAEKHNIRQGLAGCWCEPEIYVFHIARIDMDIKTAVHAGVGLDTAERILERG